ncbi:adenylate cyclase [Brumimicrobium salinarum]|uniref:Adenylate cyclase n=1 Tax=Brumimicrobium salinarum TaxID=2058658 RepID=A0A2I0R014_9FLAO|nr:CYTH domain-containing protein [Brumimicrobium salinarum]PKR79918.1 adenylate cyclase [Brumimicrobium salinarum]
MGVEIERKFLVDEAIWADEKPKTGVRICQGYLLKSKEKTVRIRTKTCAQYSKGFITIKGATEGFSRLEYEYEIPFSEAEELLAEFCPKKIIKTRYELKLNEFVWEVDEFESPQSGLILAEIELLNEAQSFGRPKWLKKEVTGEAQYYNANML